MSRRPCEPLDYISKLALVDIVNRRLILRRWWLTRRRLRLRLRRRWIEMVVLVKRGFSDWFRDLMGDFIELFEVMISVMSTVAAIAGGRVY